MTDHILCSAKQSTRTAVRFAVVVLCVLSRAAVADFPNLCPNPRFHEGSDKRPAGWQFNGKGQGVWSDKGRSPGGRSLLLKVGGLEPAEWVSDELDWTHEAADVSGWIKPRGLACEDPATNAALDLRCSDAGGRLLGNVESGSTNGTKTWQYVHRVAPVPTGTKKVRLAFHFNKLHHGEAALSDVVLLPATAERAEQYRLSRSPKVPVTVTTDRPGNVFLPGETLTFQVRTPEGVKSLPYRLADDRGLLLAQGRTDVIPNEVKNLRVAAKPEWVGRYLRLTVGEGDLGAQPSAAILPNRPTAAGGDTRFGCWITPEPVELLRMGLRIGISTAYPNWDLDASSVEVYKQHGLNLTTNGIGAEGLFQVWPYRDIYLKGFRKDERLAQWQSALRDYLQAHRGVISDFSSLGGEYVAPTEETAQTLRQIHTTFYRIAKEADPQCRVFLGMLFAQPFDLERMLASAERDKFLFDGVSYDTAGVPESAVETTLECNADWMRRFTGAAKSQWICECFSPFEDEEEKALYLARVYALALGLGCKEIDWHSFWYATPQHLWLFEAYGAQALFRGQTFQPSPAAIAHYQSYLHLSHAQPTGRLISDTNINGFGFKGANGYVAALWTRMRPATVVVRSAAKQVKVHDCMGVTYSLQPLEGKLLLGLNERLIYVQSPAAVSVERSQAVFVQQGSAKPITAGAASQTLTLMPSSESRNGDRLTLALPPGWTATPAAVVVTKGLGAKSFALNVPSDTPEGTYPVMAFATRKAVQFAARPLDVEVKSRFMWRGKQVVEGLAIEAELAELRDEKTSPQVAVKLRSFSSHRVAARAMVTSTLTDGMRPQERSLGEVSLAPGEEGWATFPAGCSPEAVPYPLVLHFASPQGQSWDSNTYVFGLAPATVAVENADLERVNPNNSNLPQEFWVADGPWEYRREQGDAHSGRSYLRLLPTREKGSFDSGGGFNYRYTRMALGVRVNPGRCCYGRVWLRVNPRAGRPMAGYGVAVCLYSGLGRWEGPTTTLALPPVREVNQWTPLDFTFVPSTTECQAWVYVDVTFEGPIVDLDDLVISEQRLGPVSASA